MKLLVISYKGIWSNPASHTGYSTIGGFTFQIQAISELFDQTKLIVTLHQSLMPPGALPLVGHHLTVQPLPAPSGADLRRKLALLIWLPRHLRTIWRAVRQADAVHTPVPGDLGTIGILIALAQRKPLFVRHCGTWGEPASLADRFLFWLLERIAGGSNVVLATGGADHPPSIRNPNIRWIFATTLDDSEVSSISPASPWQTGEPLKLVTVSRLSPPKNIQSTLRALSLLNAQGQPVTLSILGDGQARPMLEALTGELGLAGQVVFHGNVPHDQVLHHLSQSHLFVFPTRVKEGFPKAVLEAMACGLPVIATNVSVIPDLIQDCGLVLKDTEPETLACAIQSLMENPVVFTNYGSKARNKAQGYTLKRWQDEIGAHLHHAWSTDAKNG